ncbi:MAG: metal ABC transporter substrate-binding protein [Bacillota bacterium]
MKKFVLLISVLVIFVSLAACSNNTTSDESGKPLVMTTLFPHYDFAKTLGGDHVEVEYLLPPGTSAHSYEPSPQGVVRISGADLLIYTGDMMEPWVEDMVVGSGASETLDLLNLSEHVELIELGESEEEHEEEDHDDHDHGDEDVDPHFWTDPLNAIKMIENIEASLLELVEDDNAKAEISANADDYISALNQYHDDVLHVMANTEQDTIMHGGHNAFGYFVYRYNLEYITPYEGFSTDSEPTPGALSNMVDTMETHNVDTLFAETLIDPKVAEAIAEETDARILYLNTAGNVSKDALDEGVTYLDMMRENLETLKEGLDYNDPQQ